MTSKMRYISIFWGSGSKRRHLPKGHRAIGDRGRQGEGGYPNLLKIGLTSFMDGPYLNWHKTGIWLKFFNNLLYVDSYMADRPTSNSRSCICTINFELTWVDLEKTCKNGSKSIIFVLTFFSLSRSTVLWPPVGTIFFVRCWAARDAVKEQMRKRAGQLVIKLNVIARFE